MQIQFFLHKQRLMGFVAMAVEGNPYDVRTLSDALAQVERISKEPQHVGCHGHGLKVEVQIHVDKRCMRSTARSLRRWMKEGLR